MTKEKYKNEVIKIVNEFIDELEPVIKNSGNKVLDFVKEVIENKISESLEKGKEKIKTAVQKKGTNNASKETKTDKQWIWKRIE